MNRKVNIFDFFYLLHFIFIVFRFCHIVDDNFAGRFARRLFYVLEKALVNHEIKISSIKLII